MAGTAPLKSLNAVTAPGNGVTFDVQRATSNWEVQITTTGSPASFAAHLEGAIDGSTLVTIGSSITMTGLTNVTSNTPLTQVRLVLDSLTGGTAPTVTGVIVGDGPAGSGGGGGGGAATIADGADQAEGAKADAAATTDTGTFSLIALYKRLLQKFTTQFPAALGGTTAANSFAVTLSTDGPFVVQTGAINETAPATDTASSGLNGRLQRIAQRLTSLIALLPAALTGSGNLKAAIVESTATVTTTGAGGTFPVTNANLDAALSTLVPTTDFDSKTGSLTEAAPASDTASSGLNGRLQRVAQRLTSLIALLPSALISNRLDVNVGKVPGTVSSANSTTATLANAAVFTGTSEDVSGYSSVSVNVFADQSSAASGLSLQWSSNGTNWDLTNTYTVTLNVGQTIVLPPRAQFFRIVYTNGGVTQTNFRLQTVFHQTLVSNDQGAATASSSQFPATGYLGAQALLSDGTGLRIWRSGLNDNDPGANSGAVVSSLYNNAGYDRVRNNLDVTLLASAGRTTTQTSADIVTYNLGAIKVILDMTTVGTGSVTLTINEKDPASGKYILLLSGAAVVTNVTNEYTVDPMVPAVANVTAQKRVPRTIQIVVTANNANSAVYSCGYLLLPA